MSKDLLSVLPDEIFQIIFQYLIGDVYFAERTKEEKVSSSATITTIEKKNESNTGDSEEEEEEGPTFEPLEIENITTLMNVVNALNHEYSNKFQRQDNFIDYWKKVYEILNQTEYSIRTKHFDKDMQFGQGDRSFRQKLEMAKIQQVMLSYETGELTDEIKDFINNDRNYYGRDDEEDEEEVMKEEKEKINCSEEAEETVTNKYNERINHLNWKDSEELNKEIFHIVCCKLFNLSFELIDTLDSTHEVDTYSSFDSHYIIKQNHYDEWNEIEEKEDDKTLKKYKKKKRKVEYEEEEEKYGLCVPTIEIWNDNFKESKSQFAKYSILNLNNILQCNPFKNNYIFPSSIKYLSLELSDFTAFGLKKKDRSKRKEEQIETVTDISKQFHPENLKEIIFPNVRFLRVYIEKPYLYNLAISTDDLNGGGKEEEMEKKFYKLSESIDLYFKHFVNRKLFPKVNHLVLAGLFDFDHVLQCDLLPHLTTLELNFSFSDVNGYYHDFWLDEKEKEPGNFIFNRFS